MEDETSDISYDNIQDSLRKHVEKCKIKAKYHHKNGLSCMRLENVLTLLGISINATLSLLMVILTVYETEENIVAITSASLGFCSIILEKIRQNYNFALLSYSHNHIADEFMALRYEFIALLANEECDIKDFKNLINSYLSTCSKGHIQNITE